MPLTFLKMKEWYGNKLRAGPSALNNTAAGNYCLRLGQPHRQ